MTARDIIKNRRTANKSFQLPPLSYMGHPETLSSPGRGRESGSETTNNSTITVGAEVLKRKYRISNRPEEFDPEYLSDRLIMNRIDH